MKDKPRPPSYVRPIGCMEPSTLPTPRMRVRRGAGTTGSVWCAPIRWDRPTKDRVRILTGHLKAIMKHERKPLDGTVQVAPSVRRRAK